MAAEIAEAAKAAGNAAFKAGEFDEAIAKFTEAIEADPTNHVLYSNRSGAHAAKGSFKEALLDANKCIELKADWAKGHSRRGAAYVGLKNWPQAQAAYEAGLALDASSQVMNDELEKVKQRRLPASERPASFGGGGGGGGGAAPSTGRVARALSFGALVCGALYMVPILGAGRAHQAYQMAVLQMLLLFATNLWVRFPKKLSTFSDPAFGRSMESQAFVLNIFMLLSPPMPFALMPFLTGAFLNVVHGYQSQIGKLPDFAKTKLLYFTTPEGTFQINAFGAVSEVIVTFMGPLLVVLQGARSLGLTFLFFQYVSRRYKSNEQTLQVVRLFVEKCDGVCKHRFVPAPLHQVYGKLKYFIGLAADKIGSR